MNLIKKQKNYINCFIRFWEDDSYFVSFRNTKKKHRLMLLFMFRKTFCGRIKTTKSADNRAIGRLFV